MSENSHYFSDWLKIARKDWTVMFYMIEKKELTYVGFFLQQSLEKYIKAYLLNNGWKLIKTHSLEKLLDEAIKYNQSLQEFKELCEIVSSYYFIERYPLLHELELTEDELKEEIETAKKFIKAMFPNEVI